MLYSLQNVFSYLIRILYNKLNKTYYNSHFANKELRGLCVVPDIMWIETQVFWDKFVALSTIPPYHTTHHFYTSKRLLKNQS